MGSWIVYMLQHVTHYYFINFVEGLFPLAIETYCGEILYTKVLSQSWRKNREKYEKHPKRWFWLANIVGNPLAGQNTQRICYQFSYGGDLKANYLMAISTKASNLLGCYWEVEEEQTFQSRCCNFYFFQWWILLRET